jgi:hypothetical protein
MLRYLALWIDSAGRPTELRQRMEADCLRWMQADMHRASRQVGRRGVFVHEREGATACMLVSRLRHTSDRAGGRGPCPPLSLPLLSFSWFRPDTNRSYPLAYWRRDGEARTSRRGRCGRGIATAKLRH